MEIHAFWKRGDLKSDHLGIGFFQANVNKLFFKI